MLPETSSFFLLPVAGERDLVLCISAYLRMGTAGQMLFCVGAAEEEDEDGLLVLSLSLTLSPSLLQRLEMFGLMREGPGRDEDREACGLVARVRVCVWKRGSGWGNRVGPGDKSFHFLSKPRNRYLDHGDGTSIA